MQHIGWLLLHYLLLVILLISMTGCSSVGQSNQLIDANTPSISKRSSEGLVNPDVRLIRDERVDLQDSLEGYFYFIDNIVSTIMFNQIGGKKGREFGIEIMRYMDSFLKNKDLYKNNLSRSKSILESIPYNDLIDRDKNLLVGGIEGVINSMIISEKAIYSFSKDLKLVRNKGEQQMAGRKFFNSLIKAKEEKDIGKENIERSDNGFSSKYKSWPSLSKS